MNTSQQAITPTQYGILKVDDWDTHQLRDPLPDDRHLVRIINGDQSFDDSASIDHLQFGKGIRHLRTGSAVGYTTAFSTNRRPIIMPVILRRHGVGATFGRLKKWD